MTPVGVLVLLAGLGLVCSTNCPDKWLAFEGSCYLFGPVQRMDFYSAEKYCQTQGGHLVQPNDELENGFIKSELRYLKNASYWLGLTDNASEGNWVFYNSSDQVTFTDWFPGEPNSFNGTDEDCASFFSLTYFLWADVSCDSQLEPICEIRSNGDGALVG